jgi:hypothetical protein
MSGAANNVIQDGRGHTQLHRAIRDQNKPVIFSLIQQGGVNFGLRDALNHTTLFMAATEMMDAEVVAGLVRAGAAITQETAQQQAEIKNELDRALKGADMTRRRNAGVIKQLLRL